MIQNPTHMTAVEDMDMDMECMCPDMCTCEDGTDGFMMPARRERNERQGREGRRLDAHLQAVEIVVC